MRKTRRLIRGAGVGSSKMSCTSGECAETPGTPGAPSINDAIQTTTATMKSQTETIQALEAEINEPDINPDTKRYKIMRQRNLLNYLINNAHIQLKLLIKANKLTPEKQVALNNIIKKSKTHLKKHTLPASRTRSASRAPSRSASKPASRTRSAPSRPRSK